VFGQGNTDFS